MLTTRSARLRAAAAAGLLLTGLSAVPASATAIGGASTSSSGPTGAPAPAAIAPSTTVPAGALVDSVGVGVHLRYKTAPYNNYAAVKRVLLDLGVRHIRDGISYDPTKYLDLGRAGIKTLLTVPRGADSEAELNQVLSNARRAAPALSAIGGPNEYETTVSDWVPKLRSFQQRVYDKVNADPAMRHLPVLAPSLRTATNEQLLGDISQWLDFGAVHAYPRGQLPETLAEGYMREAAVNAGSKPVVITETGMTNGTLEQVRRYNLSYSERAAGVYTPRLILEYFRLGAERVYLYELLNRNQLPGMANREGFFGLMNGDFTPKPAYRSVRTLLQTLSDPGTAVDARPLSYRVASGASLRRLTFQKSDGTFYIALWNPVSVWSRGQDISPAPVGATLELPFAASSVQVIKLSQGTTPVQTMRGTARAQLQVGPDVQIVKVTR